MIAEIAAAVGGLTSVAGLASTIYFAVKHARAVEHAASVQVAQAHSKGEQTRLVFENEVQAKTIETQRRQLATLQKAYADEISRASDLAPDDVASRLRRLEVSFGTDDGLSAGNGGGSVSLDTAADAAEAAPVPEPAARLL